ncbi:MAG: MBL fold metallo-hydrolase [Clostridiales bacterium]|nr:MBL fold metallo-hydrolase [Clostridiales bacterium]
MKQIDFSSKQHIMLEDEEGLRVPMSEPYFRSKLVAPRTWQVLSDGDYSYLLEGDEEALLIDSGYGAGNIRKYCQTLTDKPLSRIANTHDHFDHTANNCYFDCAYMSAETQPLATIPFPSFEGIDFPRDYRIEIVDDGDFIPLKGRDLLVLKVPDHAVGSLVFLDKSARILFSGDEIMGHGMNLHGSVETRVLHLRKLAAYRSDYDTLCAGGGIMDAAIIDQYLANAEAILGGAVGVPYVPMPFPNFSQTDEEGRVVWKRRFPHPGDGPKNFGDIQPHKLTHEFAGVTISYDARMVRDKVLPQ